MSWLADSSLPPEVSSIHTQHGVLFIEEEQASRRFKLHLGKVLKEEGKRFDRFLDGQTGG